MARNHVGRVQQAEGAAEPQAQQGAAAEEPKAFVDRAGPGEIQQMTVGGRALGVIPEAARRVATHRAQVLAPKEMGPRPDARPKIWRLLDGPKDGATGKVRFMYGGCPSTVSVGKEFSDAAYDIDLLLRQGLKLELVSGGEGPDEPKEPAQAESAA